MRSHRVYLAFLLLGVLFSWCSGADNTSFVGTTGGRKLKILAAFNHLGKSHFDFFKPLVEELARRGHDVTVISYFPRTESAKLKEPLPNYRDISLVDPKVGVFVDVVDLRNVSHSPLRIFWEMLTLRRMATFGCEGSLRNPSVLEFLRSDATFDLILTETFNTECFMGFIHRFRAPFVVLSSHQIFPWVNERIGNPDDASYMPAIFSSFSRPMKFLERVANVLTISITNKLFNTWYTYLDQALAEEVFGPGLPPLKEITKKASALMVNTHYTLHGSRSSLPNVIEVGGLHIPSKVNALPKDIAKFLDDAKEGVLYFNFGSMIKATSLPEEKLDAILRAIGSIPRKVIWKWEADDLPYKPDNVFVKKWLPQFDILNHPNVRCYLGHGGLLGLSEGVYAGVPMVLVPMYGDQFHNAAAAKDRGVAITLHFPSLDEQTLRSALDEVFNNTRYLENSRKLSKAYRDRPANPLETAVWWSEYIGRGNALPYLKTDGADLACYQRHLFDVALFLFAALLVLLYSVYGLFKLLLLIFKAPNVKLTDRSRSKKLD